MVKEDNESDESDESNNEHEMIMIIKKFKRLIRRKGKGFDEKGMSKREASKDKKRSSQPYVMNAISLKILRPTVSCLRKASKGT